MTDVEPQSIADGLDDLEAMMAEWRALCIDVGYQLMFRVLVDYGIEPTPRQEAAAQAAYDALLTGQP